MKTLTVQLLDLYMSPGRWSVLIEIFRRFIKLYWKLMCVTWNVTLSIPIKVRHPSTYGCTAPSAPWLPPKGVSIPFYPSSFPPSHIPGIWATSSHLLLGFPTHHVLWNFPLRTFCESSSTITMWHAHSSLLTLTPSQTFKSFQRPQISIFLPDR